VRQCLCCRQEDIIADAPADGQHRSKAHRWEHIPAGRTLLELYQRNRGARFGHNLACPLSSIEGEAGRAAHALLACVGDRTTPWEAIGSKGLPLANSKPVPACVRASAKVHSAWEVGLLSGITTGRLLSSDIACAGKEPLWLSVCHRTAMSVCRLWSAAHLALVIAVASILGKAPTLVFRS